MEDREETVEDLLNILRENRFSKGDFDLQSLHQDRNRNRLNKGEDDDEDPNGAFRKRDDDSSADGIINTEWKAPFGDFCMLDGLEKFVIGPVPFRLRWNRIFHLSMTGYADKSYRIDGKAVFRCSSVQWEPRPFVEEVVNTFFYIMGIRNDSEETEIYMHPNAAMDGEVVYDKDVFLQEVDEAVANFRRSVAVYTDPPVVGRIDSLYRHEQAKMYFKSDTIHKICPTYYDEETILCMEWKDIDSLLSLISTKPHLLCLFRTIKFKHGIPSAYKNLVGSMIQTKGGRLKLPELTFNQLVKAMDEFMDTNVTEAWELIAVLIYDELKRQMNVYKHMYTSTSDMEKCYREYEPGKVDMKVFETARDWLIKNKIIYVEEKRQRYYLAQAYRWESSIAMSMQVLFEKNLREPWNQEIDVDSMKTQKGYSLCDEQKTAILSHLQFPVYMVSGPGGSGKKNSCSSRFFVIKTKKKQERQTSSEHWHSTTRPKK